MKHLLAILLTTTLLVAQSLEVEGDLTVTGSIESQTIDSLKQVIQDLQNQINGGLFTYDTIDITINNVNPSEYQRILISDYVDGNFPFCFMHPYKIIDWECSNCDNTNNWNFLHSDISLNVDGRWLGGLSHNTWLEEPYQLQFTEFNHSILTPSSEFWLDSSSDNINVTIRYIFIKLF